MNRTAVAVAAGLAVTAVTPLAQSKVPKIPICAGLTIVTAVNDAGGDYESIKTIESVTDKEIRIKYSTQKMDYGDMFSTSTAPPKLKPYLTKRTVLREDMRTSRAYLQEFAEVIPETVPGMTALGTSTEVLEDIKKTGAAEFGISHWAFAVPPGLDPNDSQSIYRKQMKVISKVQPPSPVMLPVLINGVQFELPAIHTRGDFYSYISEFWFLDQPDNPLTLKFRIGIGEHKALSPEEIEKCKSDTKLLGYPPQHCLRPGEGDTSTLDLVKITYRCGEATPPTSAGPGAAPAAGGGGALGSGSGRGAGGGAGAAQTGEMQIEEALASSEGRVEIPDIFFRFDSDEIRDESDRRLTEIAEVLKRHPDWMVKVEGHTDSIAADDYNLKLSHAGRPRSRTHWSSAGSMRRT